MASRLPGPLPGSLPGPVPPAPDASALERGSRPRAPAPLLVLGAGLALAPVFTLTPVLQYMAWFLASLTHELGHCAAAWWLGCPSFPAIRLDGHAAAVHGPQMTVLALAMWALVGWAAWQVRRRRALALSLVVLAAAYPALAFTGARELLFLLAGQGGELAFAGVFFWRALAGGFSHSTAERVAHATVGWMLLGRNLCLSFGLVTSAAARAEYADSGSFGMTNDYLRAAHDVLGCSLEAVAAGMGVLALLVLPAAVVAWRRTAG